MPVFVGTSGWQYRDWRGPFYPRDLAAPHWLEHYAAAFATVESNNAFYRLPEGRTFAEWARRTPDDFIMTVKVSRFLTHVKRLRDPEEPVERFLDRVRHLGAKLGPVLLQLPPNYRADPERLDRTLALLNPQVRVAVEFRHSSWFTGEIRDLLRRRGAALCLADRQGPRTPIWRTADWTFVRFHEGRASPPGCYGRMALATWARRLAEQWRPDEDVFVYFNNDSRACAPANAVDFARALRRAGLSPTRVATRRPRPIGR